MYVQGFKPSKYEISNRTNACKEEILSQQNPNADIQLCT